MKGGNLASIESQAEQDIVSGLASGGAWIGLSDFQVEGSFTWADGAVLGFTNWRRNQPNNGNNNQHCVWIRPAGRWDDIRCKRKVPYVCQKPGLWDSTIFSFSNPILTVYGKSTIQFPYLLVCLFLRLGLLFFSEHHCK